ncbi:hypothetical protein B0A55_11067 [Friedmanniomyces simplex]|uniref:WLM domain-containing protein n=1 Tax=Friedmanniomyces simplex TaxID=329884 RepID=A0A4U0WWB3_9PEZI|nr:hypothetical protein B0A55_11067 [Friedmanniomyces simplex]
MAVPSYTERNRRTVKGGPSGVQRSYASELKESEALFNSYEHLQGLQRGDAALKMLRQVASLVKPIMRKRGWRVQILAEFLPPEQNLLGLNVNRGYKICIRLRYHNNPDLFLPTEDVVDTMLHELSHNVWGEHDSNFHRLWDELRDEHETLVRKGYTGEGFLSEGHRVGSGRHGVPSPHEMRRLARASAEKRSAQGKLRKGSGQRLGGAPIHQHGGDVRQVIADSITRRNTVDRGCASGRQDATKLADQASSNTFKTKAEEDDANDRAIAQALFELMEQEEERKITNGTFSTAPPDGGLAWSPDSGLYDPAKGQKPSPISPQQPSEEEQLRWALRHSMAAAAPSSGSLPNMSPVSPLTPDAWTIDRTLSASSKPTPPAPEPTADEDLLQIVGNTEAHPAKVISDDTVTATKRQRTTQANHGSAHARTPSLQSPVVDVDISDPFNPDEWTCEICTCINPMQFLACDACATERPQGAATAAASARSSAAGRSRTVAAGSSTPRWTASRPAAATAAARDERLGWNCGGCGAWMERKWWTCSACGLMKRES